MLIKNISLKDIYFLLKYYGSSRISCKNIRKITKYSDFDFETKRLCCVHSFPSSLGKLKFRTIPVDSHVWGYSIRAFKSIDLNFDTCQT